MSGSKEYIENTLAKILDYRRQLISILEEVEGDVTEALSIEWENNNSALESKIDGYGYVIGYYEQQIEFLKNRKKEIDDIKKVAEEKIKTLKNRLNYFAQGNVLKGKEFKFTPYNSVTSSVDESKVEGKYFLYKLPEISSEQWDYIHDLIAGDIIEDETFKVGLLRKLCTEITSRVLVSDLPEGHPAIVKNVTPSVKKGKV